MQRKCHSPTYYHLAPVDDNGAPYLRYGDNRPIIAGATLTNPNSFLEMCRSGLHAAPTRLDALKHMHPETRPLAMTTVLLHGKIIAHKDKSVANKRTCTRIYSAAQTAAALDTFARWSIALLDALEPLPPGIARWIVDPAQRTHALAAIRRALAITIARKTALHTSELWREYATRSAELDALLWNHPLRLASGLHPDEIHRQKRALYTRPDIADAIQQTHALHRQRAIYNDIEDTLEQERTPARAWAAYHALAHASSKTTPEDRADAEERLAAAFALTERK